MNELSPHHLPRLTATRWNGQVRHQLGAASALRGLRIVSTNIPVINRMGTPKDPMGLFVLTDEVCH